MKTITTLILLFIAVQTNAQRLALYVGGGYARDFLSAFSYPDAKGVVKYYKGGNGGYVELYASTTLKNNLEIIAGTRALLSTLTISDMDYYTTAKLTYMNINPQIGIGYNRNATLSYRAGLLIGRSNAIYVLRSSTTITPYASIGHRNIMATAAFSYGLNKMIDGIPRSHTEILTIGLNYRIPVLK